MQHSWMLHTNVAYTFRCLLYDDELKAYGNDYTRLYVAPKAYYLLE